MPNPPDLESLKKRIGFLERRVSALEQQGGKAPLQEKETPYESASSNKTGAIILIILGGLLSITLVLAIIGIPLIILGIYLLQKSSKQESAAQEKTRSSPKASVPKAKEEKAKKKSGKAKPDAGLEENIGTKWLLRIGILALVIGIGYFIKYAFDNNWVGYLGRIIVGISVGAALVLLGQFLAGKQAYGVFGNTLSGGGFAIAYFSVYAAYHFERYREAIGIPYGLDIALLSLVVVSAIALSLKSSSRSLASIAFFLGFVTSFLSSKFETLTLVYGLLLTIGIVFVVAYKRWTGMGLAGIFATYIVYLFWASQNEKNFVVSSFFLIAYFAAYTAQSFFVAKQQDKAAEAENVAITLINSVFFYLLYSKVVDYFYPGQSTLVALALSIAYGALFMLPNTGKLRISALYLSIAYFTLWAFLQISRELVTLLWVIEALLLAVFAVNFDSRHLRISCYAVSFLAGAKLLFYDVLFLKGLDFSNLPGSTRTIALLFSAACFCIIYLVFKKNNEKGLEEFSVAAHIYAWAATFFLSLTLFVELTKHTELTTALWALAAVLLLAISLAANLKELQYPGATLLAAMGLKVLVFDWTLEPFNSSLPLSSARLIAFSSAIIAFYFVYFALRKVLASFSKKQKEEALSMAAAVMWAANFFLAEIIALELTKHSEFTTALWAIISASLIFISFKAGMEELKYPAIAMSLAAGIKAALFDWRLEPFNSSSPLSSARLIAFLSVIITYYAVSRYLEVQKRKKGLKTVDQSIHQIFSWSATSLAAFLILLEMKDYWISVGWALLAIAVLFAGFTLSLKRLRLQGIAVFALTIFKVFLYDTRNLDTIYRTISFLVLGAILLLASFFYAKYKDKIMSDIIKSK